LKVEATPLGHPERTQVEACHGYSVSRRRELGGREGKCRLCELRAHSVSSEVRPQPTPDIQSVVVVGELGHAGIGPKTAEADQFRLVVLGHTVVPVRRIQQPFQTLRVTVVERVSALVPPAAHGAGLRVRQ